MSPRATEDGERLELAETYLREVVFRSRERQASATAFAAPTASDAPGRCGLGEKVSVALDLSERASELFARLWPVAPEAVELERIRGVMSAWVIEQDAFDRKRNHFLKAFRAAHGFDRTQYGAAETLEYERELERINGRENEARRAAAAQLVAVQQL